MECPAPGIFADALEIVRVGVAELIDDVTANLKLSPEEIQTADASEIEREAARMVAEIDATHETKLWTQAAREGLPRFRFFRRSIPPAELDAIFHDSRLEARWLRLKSMMQPGDQIWPFSFSVRSFLGLREGYLLLRRDKPIGGIVTIVS